MIHPYVNSKPGVGYDNDCSTCGGKFRDSAHGATDEERLKYSQDQSTFNYEADEAAFAHEADEAAFDEAADRAEALTQDWAESQESWSTEF